MKPGFNFQRFDVGSVNQEPTFIASICVKPLHVEISERMGMDQGSGGWAIGEMMRQDGARRFCPSDRSLVCKEIKLPVPYGPLWQRYDFCILITSPIHQTVTKQVEVKKYILPGVDYYSVFLEGWATNSVLVSSV